MSNPDPTTHLTLRELHEELGKLLASHLMPDVLTNVTRVILNNAKNRIVICEAEAEIGNYAEIEAISDELADSEATVDILRDEVASLKAKLLACQQGP